MSTQQETQVSLHRQLTPLYVWAIAFGCIIGWGSFVNPGKCHHVLYCRFPFRPDPRTGCAWLVIWVVLGGLLYVVREPLMKR